MNTQFPTLPHAGGIVPFVKSTDGVIHFLLGYENFKWSGFVGGYEVSDDGIIGTAVREFNEETAKIFENELPFVKNKILTNDALLITGRTKNRIVYLWFVEFPFELKLSNVEQQFLNTLPNMTDKHYCEKEKLKWFSFPDIKKSKVLYKLKQVILDNHLRL